MCETFRLFYYLVYSQSQKLFFKKVESGRQVLKFVFSFENKIWKKVKWEPSSRTEIADKNLACKFFLYFGILQSSCDVILLHLIRLIDDK